MITTFQNCSGLESNSAGGDNANIEDNILLEDMILDENALISKGGDTGGISQAASGLSIYNSKPWAKGIVPLKFNLKTKYKKDYEKQVYALCAEWSRHANVQCVPYAGESNYVSVTDSSPGCSASVGAGLSGGVRILNVGSNRCLFAEVLLHELGHIFGLMHEHQRPDRDTYITINEENILPEYVRTFAKLQSVDSSSSYDFDSIMHYDATAFSKNGRATITVNSAYKKQARNMGRTTSLSANDKAIIAKLYSSEEVVNPPVAVEPVAPPVVKEPVVVAPVVSPEELARIAAEEEARKATEAARLAQIKADQEAAAEKHRLALEQAKRDAEAEIQRQLADAKAAAEIVEQKRIADMARLAEESRAQLQAALAEAEAKRRAILEANNIRPVSLPAQVQIERQTPEELKAEQDKRFAEILAATNARVQAALAEAEQMRQARSASQQQATQTAADARARADAARAQADAARTRADAARAQADAARLAAQQATANRRPTGAQNSNLLPRVVVPGQ